MMLPTALEANHRGLSPNSDERVTPTSAPRATANQYF